MVEARPQFLPPQEKELPAKFLEMLSLPKFKKALKIAGRHTGRTGLETAFCVHSVGTTPYWIERVRVGQTDRMGESVSLKEIDGSLDYNLLPAEYFDFHFHPFEKGIAIPSPDDIETFQFPTECPEYLGVGQVDSKGNVSIIVVAKPKYRLIGHDIRFYDLEVDKITNHQELQDVLQTIGLSSFVVGMRI
jgi:hypothetical protein